MIKTNRNGRMITKKESGRTCQFKEKRREENVKVSSSADFFCLEQVIKVEDLSLRQRNENLKAASRREIPSLPETSFP